MIFIIVQLLSVIIDHLMFVYDTWLFELWFPRQILRAHHPKIYIHRCYTRYLVRSTAPFRLRKRQLWHALYANGVLNNTTKAVYAICVSKWHTQRRSAAINWKSELTRARLPEDANWHAQSSQNDTPGNWHTIVCQNDTGILFSVIVLIFLTNGTYAHNLSLRCDYASHRS